MDKKLNFINKHLQNFGFKFFNDESYWEWSGRQLNDGNIPKKELNQLIKLTDQMSYASFADKKKFYDFLPSNDLFIKVVHSMKSNAIAASCLAITNEIKNDTTILDLGCNVGYLTSFYSFFLNKSKIIGIDISKKSIIKAKELHKREKNLVFYDNYKELNKYKFDFIVDTQCLSEINDHQILIYTIRHIYKLLNENGCLISVSNLKNDKKAKDLHNVLTEYGFYINRLEPIIYQGISGFEAYTKIVLTKKRNEFVFDFKNYFSELNTKLDKKNIL